MSAAAEAATAEAIPSERAQSLFRWNAVLSGLHGFQGLVILIISLAAAELVTSPVITSYLTFDTVTDTLVPAERALFNLPIGPAVAAGIGDSLSDPLARVRGLGGSGPFDIGFPVAVKTGTSSGFRDTWTVGYTHERTVAVWVGNASGRETRAARRRSTNSQRAASLRREVPC